MNFSNPHVRLSSQCFQCHGLSLFLTSWAKRMDAVKSYSKLGQSISSQVLLFYLVLSLFLAMIWLNSAGHEPEFLRMTVS